MPDLSLTDPVNGTTADATLIAVNNAAIKTLVNGGLKNDNIAPDAAIDASKIAGVFGISAQIVASITASGNHSFTTTLVAGTYIVGFGMGSVTINSLGRACSLTTDKTSTHTATGGTTNGSGGSVFVPGITVTANETFVVSCAGTSPDSANDVWIIFIQTA